MCVQYCGGVQYCAGVQYHGGVQYRGDMMSTVGVFSTVGDIMSTVGVFSTMGVILSTVGDILSTMGMFSTMRHMWGYHKYRGDIMSTVGGYHDACRRISCVHDSFEVEKFESHSFNKPFHDRNFCFGIYSTVKTRI